MNERIRYRRLITFALGLILWGIITGVWVFVWYRFFSRAILRPFGYKGNWMVIAVYGVILYLFNQLYGGYRIGYYKRGDVVFAGFISVFITNFITWMQASLIARRLVSGWVFLVMTLVDFLVIWLWGVTANKYYYHIFPPYEMLLIHGNPEQAFHLMEKIKTRKEKYNIKEILPISAGLETVLARISQYQSVILCDIGAQYRSDILKFCFSKDIRTYITPKISDIILRGAKEVHLFDTPLLLCNNFKLTPEQFFLKRCIDLFCSVLMLFFFSPIMLLTALAIKLYDKGPILYKQERLTYGGRHFMLYKFRSMIVDAEKQTGSVLASEHDSRITPVGALIRRLRLDEFPQLINVIKGEMSLVGPRPERPELAAKNEIEMPEFSYRLRVPAGLTGYAQVIGKYNTPPYEKLKLDLMYITNYSVLLDIKLLLMTFKTIFSRGSTDGVRYAQKTNEDKKDALLQQGGLKK